MSRYPRYRVSTHSDRLPCPDALYRTALEQPARRGSYHQNVRVNTPGGPVLVRIPVSGATQMDLRLWPEPEVLRLVRRSIDEVPRLLHVSADPPYQIHEYIPWDQLNEIAPRGVAVPDAVVPAVLALFDRLTGIPHGGLPPVPANWPDDGRCADFAHLLSSGLQRIYDEHRTSWGELFGALGVPTDPLAAVSAHWPGLTARPFRLLHGDVHRQNLLVSPDGRQVVFLDWELALYGDPLYDLAVHLTKMSYLEPESRRLLDGWTARADPATQRGWHHDLPAYRHLEQVKAAIVHTIRYSPQILAATTGDATRRAVLLGKLTGNLNAAGRGWGWHRALTTSEVEQTIHTHRDQVER